MDLIELRAEKCLTTQPFRPPKTDNIDTENDKKGTIVYNKIKTKTELASIETSPVVLSPFSKVFG
ncbi:9360_t:CDS:2, partial [Dentiscutata erythropus]